MSSSCSNFCWSQLSWLLANATKRKGKRKKKRKERKGKGKSRNHLKEIVPLLVCLASFTLTVVSNLSLCLVHNQLMRSHLCGMAKYLAQHAHHMPYCLLAAEQVYEADLQNVTVPWWRTLRLRKGVRGPSFNQFFWLLGYPPQDPKPISNIWAVPSHP